MKYKTGDKIKIKYNRNGHGFQIGDIVEIIKVNTNSYQAEQEDGTWWNIWENEIEPFQTEWDT